MYTCILMYVRKSYACSCFKDGEQLDAFQALVNILCQRRSADSHKEGKQPVNDCVLRDKVKRGVYRRERRPHDCLPIVSRRELC